MIRHIALFRWKEGASAAAIDALRTALETMPGRIPDIRRYEMGADLGLVDGTFDFALVAEFDDTEAYRRYAEHPDHQALSRDYVAPILDHLARVQHEI